MTCQLSVEDIHTDMVDKLIEHKVPSLDKRVLGMITARVTKFLESPKDPSLRTEELFLHYTAKGKIRA